MNVRWTGLLKKLWYIHRFYVEHVKIVDCIFGKDILLFVWFVNVVNELDFIWWKEWNQGNTVIHQMISKLEVFLYGLVNDIF